MEVNLDRFYSEIRTARNVLINAITNRKTHPSYGYTKKDILANYFELQGMCYSYLYITGRWDHAGRITLTEEVNEILMIDLSVDLLKLYVQAKNS